MNYKILMLSNLASLNQKAKNIEESFNILSDFLSDENTEAFLDWEENFFWRPWDFIIDKKHYVDRINNIKIEVRSNEHAPPHFHINFWDYEWSYEIENCNKLNWSVPKTYEKKIKMWFKYWWKDKLIEKWNNTRPENCKVWKIKI